jgi:sensor histidine kinase regulating citrate/malate metabolism
MNTLPARGRCILYARHFFFAVFAITFETIHNVAVYSLTIFSTIFSLIVLCYAIINTQEKTRQRAEAEFARGIVSSGREYYQKMDEMYEKLKALRHDYKFHLNAARQMLGSGDTEGADRYLTDAGKQLSELETTKYCDNPVINALTAGYAERCAHAGITFDVSLVTPESSAVGNYDLCIIVGNLLENAVEASAKLEHGRFIVFDTKIKRAQLLLMVKNSFNGEIRCENGMPLSAKTNGGFGLRSVREIIAHYDGEFAVEWDNGIFTAYAAVKM